MRKWQVKFLYCHNSDGFWIISIHCGTELQAMFIDNYHFTLLFRLKFLLHEFLMLGNQTEVFNAFQAAADDFRDVMCWSNRFTDFLLSAPPASCTNVSEIVMFPGYPLVPTRKPGKYPDMNTCNFPPKVRQ